MTAAETKAEKEAMRQRLEENKRQEAEKASHIKSMIQY